VGDLAATRRGGRWVLRKPKGHDGAVLPRVLAAAATASSVLYLVGYVWVIDAQDGAIAWLYVVLMVLAALSSAAAALGTWARAALTVGLVTSALAMLVALLSLGVLLAPTVVAAAIAPSLHAQAHSTCGNGRTTAESATRGSPLAGPLTALSAGLADLADGGDARASGGTLDRPMDNRIRATARSCRRASGT
jgi:hypothetical protein